METIKFRRSGENSKEVEVNLIPSCPWSFLSDEVGKKLGFDNGIESCTLVDDDGDSFGGAIRDSEKFWRYYTKRCCNKSGMAFVAIPNLSGQKSVGEASSLNNASMSPSTPEYMALKMSKFTSVDHSVNSYIQKDIPEFGTPGARKISTLSHESPSYEKYFFNKPYVPVRFRSSISDSVIVVDLPTKCDWSTLVSTLVDKLMLGMCKIERIILTDADDDAIGRPITDDVNFWKTLMKNYKDQDTNTFITYSQQFEIVHARLTSDLNKRADISIASNISWDELKALFQKAFVITDMVKKLVLVDQKGSTSQPITTMTDFWNSYRKMGARNVKDVFAVLENEPIGSSFLTNSSILNSTINTTETKISSHIDNHSIGMSSESVGDGFGRRLQSRQLIPSVEPSLTDEGYSYIRFCMGGDRSKKCEISVPTHCGWEKLVENICSGFKLQYGSLIRHLVLIASDGSHLTSNIYSAPEFWRHFMKSYRPQSHTDFVVFLHEPRSGTGTGSENLSRTKPSEMKQSESFTSGSSYLQNVDKSTPANDSVVSVASSDANGRLVNITQAPVVVDDKQVDNSDNCSTMSNKSRSSGDGMPSRLHRRQENSNKVSTQLFMEASKFSEIKDNDDDTAAVIPSIPPIPPPSDTSTQLVNCSSPRQNSKIVFMKVIFAKSDTPSDKKEAELEKGMPWEQLCESVSVLLDLKSTSETVTHVILFDAEGDMLSPVLNGGPKFWKFCAKYKFAVGMVFRVFCAKTDSDSVPADALEPPTNNTTEIVPTEPIQQADDSSINAVISNPTPLPISDVTIVTSSDVSVPGLISKANDVTNTKLLEFRCGDPSFTAQISLPIECPWQEVTDAVAAAMPPIQSAWIQNFTLTDNDGEHLSLALSNGVKFWKMAMKFRINSGSFFNIGLDDEAIKKSTKCATSSTIATNISQKQSKSNAFVSFDAVVKVRLHSEKKRFAYASITSKSTWDSFRDEVAMSLGLITGNRISHFVLIDGDNEQISAELAVIDKVKNVCEKVYREESGMLFDVYVLEVPQKTHAPQPAPVLFNTHVAPSPIQAFHMACVSGDISACRRLALSGVDIMAKDENGMFALHLASLAGHIDIVKWLLSLKINVDLQDQNDMTALHCACDGMHSSLVLVLVDAGGNLLARNTYGLTPIHYIALRGLIELTHLLKPHTINLASSSGLTCLHCASDGGHEEMTEYLLTHGAHVDARDYEGLTPLHYACLSGNWTAAQILIEYGAFWNVRDDEGMSPLLYACHEGHLEIVQWLAAIGGSIFARNDLGHTALHLACASGSIELVNWLLMRGVDLDCRSKSGLTPFHFASDAGNVELAEFLSAAGGGLWMENEAEATARCRVDEDNEMFLRACEAEEERIHQESFGSELDVDATEEESGPDPDASSSEGPLDPQLRDACSKGNVDLVVRLLRGSANPNAKNANGSTSLHFACAIGNLAIAKKLVEAGARVSVANMRSSTPLHFSCDRNHVELSIWLAEQGADLYAKNGEGYTPLHYLSTRGKSDVLSNIAKIRDDFDPNCCGSKDISLLHCAAEQGHPEMIHVLVKLGALVDSVDDENETPLHYACLRGHLLAAKALVSHKAVLNVRDNEGSTPLFYACASGSVELAKWLVAQGALLHNINRRGNTCLHVACKVGSTDMAMWLVDAGIDVDFKNANGHTPMDFAIAGKHSELVKALERKIEEAKEVAVAQAETIAAFHKAATLGNLNVINQIIRDGMDVNIRNANQSTAMHFACMSGQAEVVNRLFAAKVDLNAANHTGLTPFLCVCIHGNLDLVQWLAVHGAEMTSRTTDGRTALHHAALNGHLPIVKWLVSTGADLVATSTFGLTPISDACYGGHLDVLKHLAKEGAPIIMKAAETAPIHIASEQGHLDVVMWLMESGAPADIADSTFKTPFLYACLQGQLDVAQWLARNGVNIRATGGASDRLNTALHLACQNGHIDVVKWLVECGLDINAENEHKHTPIDFASAAEHKELVRWLTERGAQYFSETIRTKKQPKLEEALETNDFTLARKLLEDLVLSVDPTAQCAGGASPIHYAAASGHIDLAQHLIICGADINTTTARGLTPLHYAASKGQTEIVQYLAGLGARLNVVDKSGSTPMDVASKFKHIETFHWLRDNGGLTSEQMKDTSKEMYFERSMLISPFACLTSNPTNQNDIPSNSKENSRGMDISFRTIGTSSHNGKIPTQTSFESIITKHDGEEFAFSLPLHEACSAGDFPQVRSLVESGAGVNAPNPTGASSSLHLACVSGDMQIVQYLVDKGAKLDLQNVGGMTPLHVACDRRFTEVSLYLIRKGANILERNKIGDTPLHKLCARGMVELLEAIIDLPRSVLPNLDLEFKTDRGATPLHAAVDQGCLSVVKVLNAQGVQVNPRDEENKTPLHYACIKGHQNIAVFLKDSGAFINARDNLGMTPLLLAVASEQPVLAKWLVGHGANIRAITDSGDSCLHIACRVGSLDMVKWLLENRLDPRLPNNLNITPEQYAEDRGYSEIVSYVEDFISKRPK